MSNTISPNMGLIIPGVGTELGPTWASDLNADLGILDQHNHSSGQGSKINPNGININSDFSMAQNNLTQVKTVNFYPQIAALAGIAPDLGCVYVAGNELYYNDEAGNVVPITNNGSVNAGAGSITGLPSGTASASYSSGSGTFVWQSATSTPADMDNSAVTIREKVSGGKGVTLSAPTALAVDYGLFFPTGLPSGTSFLTVDSSGNMADSAVFPLTGGDIANGTITNTNIANGTIEQIKIADRTSPGSTAAVVGEIAISATQNSTFASTTYVNLTSLSVTITTSGRPVMLRLDSVVGGDTQSAIILAVTGGAVNNGGLIQFVRDGTALVSQEILFSNFNTSANYSVPSSSFSYMDVVGAGTYNYTMQAKTGSSATFGSMTIVNTILIAYEI